VCGLDLVCVFFRCMCVVMYVCIVCGGCSKMVGVCWCGCTTLIYLVLLWVWGYNSVSVYLP